MLATFYDIKCFLREIKRIKLISENARHTPVYAGVYRRRSAWSNYPAMAVFGGGGQACSVLFSFYAGGVVLVFRIKTEIVLKLAAA